MNWFERLTGGLSIGVAILLYLCACVTLTAFEEMLHTREAGGGFWWTALMLAVLLRTAYSVGQSRAQEAAANRYHHPSRVVSTPDAVKRAKEFNQPL